MNKKSANEGLIDLSMQQVFYGMGSMAILILMLYVGSAVLIPLTMALLISFILYPICRRVETWGLKRVLATVVIIGVTTLTIAGVFVLLSSQVASIAEELSSFEMKLKEIFDTSIHYLNHHVSLVPKINKQDILNQGEELAKESGGSFVVSTLSQTGAIFSGALMTLVYTFLFLIYRRDFKHAIQQFAKKDDRSAIGHMISKMQKVGQSYLSGMATMIGILGAANSIILLLFGLENAIFFGFLAALLAIIPYIGTTVGAVIPVIYAFMTYDSIWIPVGIAISFWMVQVIESNYLTPRIVGGNLNINALASILALIVGGYLWGVAGMVLFLPLTAIFKVFCESYRPFKPIGLLLGDQGLKNNE